MTSSKEWADKHIENIRRVGDEAARLAASLQTQTPQQGKDAVAPNAQAGVTPHAVATALAEAVKNDDSTTQAIAIRLSNLAAKYPERAY